MDSNTYVNLNESRFISITGEDKSLFLQGLITNDINKCKIANPIYSCLLTPQGKFIADFFISIFENEYLIEINKIFYESFFNKLNLYKLRSKISISENKKLKSLFLFNKNISLENHESLIIFDDPRNSFIGKKVYIDENYLKSFLDINNLISKDYINYREILIKNLIPYSPVDLSVNKSLLLENNFDNINAIDWEKGCYIGQEITARMKYRALLKKQIYVLELISGKIDKGDDIIIDNINIGKVISKVNKYILCMLKIDLVKEKNENKKSFNIAPSTNLKFL